MNAPWICPKCGRVYGPNMPQCLSCNDKAESTANDKRLYGTVEVDPQRPDYAAFERAKRTGK